MYRDINKIKIIEIGPGTGALAASIMEFFKNNDVEKKTQIEYNLVEISSSLCETIESRFKSINNELLENGKVKIYNSSIFDYKIKEEGPTFVIGMEILDNMPHDRLYRKSGDIDEPWIYQAVVSKVPLNNLNYFKLYRT